MKEENPGIRIHRVSPSLHGLGLIEVKTPMGNTTRCYDAERSVADLIKQRSKGVSTLSSSATPWAAISGWRDAILRAYPRCAKPGSQRRTSNVSGGADMTTEIRNDASLRGKIRAVSKKHGLRPQEVLSEQG